MVWSQELQDKWDDAEPGDMIGLPIGFVPRSTKPKLIIERLDPSVPMPKYAREGDSGFDLHVGSRGVEKTFEGGWFQIQPGRTVQVAMGVRADIPEGYEVQIRPRSGKASKGLVAQFGTVDSGYRGEWMVILHNNTTEVRTVDSGDRIAQAVLVPVTQANIVEGAVSTDTERGEAGFGSTGR